MLLLAVIETVCSPAVAGTAELSFAGKETTETVIAAFWSSGLVIDSRDACRLPMLLGASLPERRAASAVIAAGAAGSTSLTSKLSKPAVLRSAAAVLCQLDTRRAGAL